MINYEEELKKFKPCLEVGEVEEAIHNQELTDVIDIVKEMLDNNARLSSMKAPTVRAAAVMCLFRKGYI